MSPSGQYREVCGYYRTSYHIRNKGFAMATAFIDRNDLSVLWHVTEEICCQWALD